MEIIPSFPNSNYSHLTVVYSSLPRYVTTEEEYTNCGRKSAESAENGLKNCLFHFFSQIVKLHAGQIGQMPKVGRKSYLESVIAGVRENFEKH